MGLARFKFLAGGGRGDGGGIKGGGHFVVVGAGADAAKREMIYLSDSC